MKTEKGIMIMRNGAAWGITYQDGQSTSYGWMNPEDAILFRDSPFAHKIEDHFGQYERNLDEIKTGKVFKVKRTTTIEVIEEHEFKKESK